MDLDVVFNEALRLVGPVLHRHWSFFMYTAILAFVGEVMQRHVFTAKNLEWFDKEGVKQWNRKGGWRVLSVFTLAFAHTPFAFHPAVAGFLLGLIPGVAVASGVHYGIQSALYCMGAGIASLAFYDIIHAVFNIWWKYILRRTEPVPVITLPGEEVSTNEEPSEAPAGEDQ